MLPLIGTPCSKSDPDNPHRPGDRPVDCPECLQFVNVVMTIVRPYPGKDTEFNQAIVFQNYQHINYLVKDLNQEEQYLFVRKMEAMAAAAGACYQQTLIKNRTENPKSLAISADYAKNLQKQKDNQRPAKERKLLDAREKAILALTKIGMPQAIAEKQVDEQMSKEGRNPGK